MGKFGFRHSEETKRKMSVTGLLHPNRTYAPLSTEHRNKISQSNIGLKRTPESRQNIAKGQLGQKRSIETRRKIRISWITRRKIPLQASIDIGAADFFDSMNSHNGFHIQHPNVYFKELGYFADGYDTALHAWFEYDTPRHSSPRSKERDLNRQREILQYFESIGKPLSAFYRINRTGKGQPGLYKAA